MEQPTDLIAHDLLSYNDTTHAFIPVSKTSFVIHAYP